MSQWTHVCGLIRVDSIDFGGDDLVAKIELEDALGPISSYEHRCDTNAPSGSEGSLQWKILDGTRYINRFNIAIWGDLRDYGSSDEDIDEIRRWFKNVCKSCMMVRDAVLHIHVEFRKGITLLYHSRDQDGHYTETIENLYEPKKDEDEDENVF